MSDEGKQLFEELMRFKPKELTGNGWAVKAGVSRTIWADLKRHGNPSRRTLGKLLSVAGSSLAEFEAVRVGLNRPVPNANRAAGVGEAHPADWRAAPLPPIPVLSTVAAREWGEPGSGIELTELRQASVRGHVARPASLVGDRRAYAVEMLGDAMWPRFRPGRRLLVSPAAPVAIGDDVLVRLADDPAAQAARILIKELVRRTAAFVELRQFNPDMTFKVESAAIISLHKVVGEAL